MRWSNADPRGPAAGDLGLQHPEGRAWRAPRVRLEIAREVVEHDELPSAIGDSRSAFKCRSPPRRGRSRRSCRQVSRSPGSALTAAAGRLMRRRSPARRARRRARAPRRSARLCLSPILLPAPLFETSCPHPPQSRVSPRSRYRNMCRNRSAGANHLVSRLIRASPASASPLPTRRQGQRRATGAIGAA